MDRRHRPETQVDDAARRRSSRGWPQSPACLPLAAHLAEHDIEHVHRLRVATRRAVAALKLYRDCWPDKPARWMKKRLRKIRRAAGDARDLDVLADRLARDYGERVAPIVELSRTNARPSSRRSSKLPNAAARRPIRPQDGETATAIDSDVRKSRRPSASRAIEFGKWAAEQLANVAGQFLDRDAERNIRCRRRFTNSASARRPCVMRSNSSRRPSDPNCARSLYPIVEELQERLGQVQDHVTADERFQNGRADRRVDDAC